MLLYNSLTRKKEEFLPISPPNVGVYTCGLTVYDYASIGNLRTYTTSDVLRRALTFNGYKVKAVMNITDVGHLTGDGDLGADRVEVKAKLEGKSARDITKFYTEAFVGDLKKMNILMPDKMPRATEHIPHQIKLIKTLEEKELTYETSDGIYFDTQAYERQTGKVYGELSTLDELKRAERELILADKRNPRDFALWKFSSKKVKRQMEWDSPWGVGFPGWHIECSAMSMEYLGKSFDIHVGGEDLRQTHHPNELAQSEGATGQKFVNYWVHVTFLLVDGKRMGRSLGNVYTLTDIEKRGIDPLALRYLYLTAHYRDPLNFTWESLSAAQSALERLRDVLYNLKFVPLGPVLRLSSTDGRKDSVQTFKKLFLDALNDDLSTPRALAVLWDSLKSSLTSGDKVGLLAYFDEVLGLGLAQLPVAGQELPVEVEELVKEREELRKQGKWEEADKLRERIEEAGYTLEDTAIGPRIRKTKLT